MSSELQEAMRSWAGLVAPVEVDAARASVIGPLRVPVVPVGAPVVIGQRGRR
jgi:hypothetical protein